jgi:hypothetical protein
MGYGGSSAKSSLTLITKYCYPDEVQSDLAKSLYWDLMNWIRRKPIVEKFTVTKYLKMRY